MYFYDLVIFGIFQARPVHCITNLTPDAGDKFYNSNEYEMLFFIIETIMSEVSLFTSCINQC